MNGTQTERIGTWAFIQTTKETAKAATPEQFQRYMTGLDAEDYNWFNVFFEDGTGLYIASGTAGTWVEYGAIDQEEGGAVQSGDSIMFYFEDNEYIQANGFIDTEAIDIALLEIIPQTYQDEKWFFAYSKEDGNVVNVSIQIDQRSNDTQAARILAAECYGYAKEAAEEHGALLGGFDISIVNSGAPCSWIMTRDGKIYTSIESGKRTEYTMP